MRCLNLANTQQNGIINLDLPNNPCGPTDFLVSSIDYNSEQDYYWFGDFDDYSGAPCFSANLSLIKKDDLLYGTVMTQHKTYSLYGLSSENALLVETDIDLSGLESGNDCGVVGEYLRPLESNYESSGRSVCVARVLVIYDPSDWPELLHNVLDEMAGDLIINQANQILENSEVLNGNRCCHLISLFSFFI